METNAVLIIAGLVINLLATVMAITRSSLRTESRITRVETLVSMLVREVKPKDVHLRSTDKDEFNL